MIEKKNSWKRTAGFRFSRMKKIANQLRNAQLSSSQPKPIFQESNLRHPFERDSKNKMSLFWTRQESNLTRPFKKRFDWIKKKDSWKNSWFSLFSNAENRKPADVFSPTIIYSKTIFQESNLRHPFETDFKCRFFGRSRNRTWSVLEKTCLIEQEKQFKSREQLVFAFLE